MPDSHAHIQPLLVTAGEGTTRCVHSFGSTRVESVIMRRTSINGAGRGIVCLSSQAGCAMGCKFCATASMGLVAQLHAGQIIAQAEHARSWLARRSQRLTNAVFMGMGEPLHNLTAVLEATDWLLHPKGAGLARKRVCISTVGLVPQLEAMIGVTKVALAWSLHAPNDELRSRLVPSARKYSIVAIKQRLMDYLAWCGGGKRQVLVAYTLIGGVNDSPQLLAELVEQLRGLSYQLNVIPYNRVDGLPWKASPAAQCEAFVAEARRLGIRTTLRHSHGQTKAAACGQLALQSCVA